MTAAKFIALGLYRDRPVLETAVQKLKDAGYTEAEISVILKQPEPNTSVAGGEVGAGIGAAVGGVLGGLVGAGLLAIPGIGALVILGPLGTALAGATALGGVGGITGSFVGLGLSDSLAAHYESRVKQGEHVLAVECDDAQRGARALQILRETGAQNIHSPEPQSHQGPGVQF